MDLNEIINDIKKYHYTFANSSKAAILESNNNLSDAKNNVLKLIKDNIDDFTDRTIIQIKLKKTDTDLYEKSRNSKFTSIDGPIFIELNFFDVNKNGSLKKSTDYNKDVVWITEKYLEQYKKKINRKHLKKISVKFINNKIKRTALSVLKIENFL